MWVVPAAVGPTAAGYILDNFTDPRILWVIGAVLCAVAALAFYGLHVRLGKGARFSAATTASPASDPVATQS